MIVLDTHIWVWWVARPDRLQARHRDLLENGADRAFGVSIISCWEVAKLVEYGRLTLDRQVGAWIESALAGPGVSLLPLHPRIEFRPPSFPLDNRYAIEAKADGLPTKDQMRLMMQSLLAERFQLAVHFETQDTAVFALTLVKPGKLGPKLRPHSEGPPCEDSPATAFPPECYVQMMTMKGSQLQSGSRATTMDQLAEAIPVMGRLDRTVVDRTGISGEVDYEIEFLRDANPNEPPSANAAAADPGPTFLQAVREQLGLKLEPARAPLRVLTIDHIERPSEN